MQLKDASPFCSELYTEQIKIAVQQFGFTATNAQITENVQYKGISYKRGQFVVIRNVDWVELGEVIFLILKDNSALHFLVKVHVTEFMPHYHMFSVRNVSDRLLCLHLNDLVDVWSLPSYVKDGHQIVPLKHSVLSL